MASHGEITQGNQLFISIRKGKEWPAKVFDVRIHYDESIKDIKEAVCSKLGIPLEKLQLFHHKKEVTQAYDARTLNEMELHTGFALQGWDLSEPPHYWPRVKEGPHGLELDC
ncbi:hypothetical protein CEUSTIGMA_g3571.t1 [Chlamydomonas eustigma]|uniref:UBP24/USP9X/USP9Y ubiquitin-like domain-containing protein n=1 Tax=Chlamydomonas eustigma TaxID=1157962 RepID=A0A250WZ62_9CHLO|nr:hypothetical protein CEUSTIGMA_g3571.t1 [Chlamydomonas eustigma]|eukprot:GAX76128.1 hypothetical protein CEUSTIGMA_g3571.t1 [Chlamydomonas eustigma]